MYQARVMMMAVHEYDNETGEVGDFIMTKEGYHIASAETMAELRDKIDNYFGHELEIDDGNPEYLCTTIIENETCQPDKNGDFCVDYTVIANYIGRVNFRAVE